MRCHGAVGIIFKILVSRTGWCLEIMFQYFNGHLCTVIHSPYLVVSVFQSYREDLKIDAQNVTVPQFVNRAFNMKHTRIFLFT